MAKKRAHREAERVRVAAEREQMIDERRPDSRARSTRTSESLDAKTAQR